MRQVPSPNHNGRGEGVRPDIVVIHYTDMTDAESAVRWLCNPASKVSCHYLIGADGALVQMVEETRRAWHAGVSAWDGTGDINSRSIGIELDSPGHRPDAPCFPQAQMASLLALLDGIRSRWPVPRRNVVGHSDIAPERKIDPGERFPWADLAAAGHALHVAPAAAEPFQSPALRAELAAGGYAVPPQDGPAMDALVAAFHRRHLPERVGAPADGVTLATARAFAAAVAADRAAG
ncbi:N-acetylmuramoyl-L-alanine amidase [Acuticoccus sp. 2012]|uniref:N-acetylmuramoyl-L-alanine amidase n=1 Tax=Acuticoccus mangrovi TaxID=2796142 RepID=A0A934IRF4_9HYPH|nr:N-acetylmuramoyl-L-alanine amidase [Acuticoccus mangrovi]MBJ3776685.1 N-acetylmuramoyl-L-alanine amidase [Acuticoccus mangrovi]